MRPDLLVLTSRRGVDGRRKHELAGLTRRLATGGAGVGGHPMDFAADVADEVTTLAAGRVSPTAGRAARDRQFFVSQVGLALGGLGGRGEPDARAVDTDGQCLAWSPASRWC
jgi:hypothetical protein